VNIIINKIQDASHVIDGDGTTLYGISMTPVTPPVTEEGVYLILNPVTGENLQANTLAELYALYDQISSAISEFQKNTANPVNFLYRLYTNPPPYVSNDSSPDPHCLEIL
jgi:hypothetical protein